jgi:hypothetical protein
MSLILDGTNGLSDIDGSAATPAIRGTDANTGIFFPAADTIAFSEGGVEAARINSSGNLQTIGTISVGNATPSTSGAGITFPATQSASSNANTLDDYEEGTWTPSIGGNATYSGQAGGYTKIGRVVALDAILSISSSTTGSGTTITGIPFTAQSPGGSIAGSMGYFSGLQTSVVYLNVVADGSSLILVSLTAAGSTTSVSNNILNGSGPRVDFCITYRA